MTDTIEQIVSDHADEEMARNAYLEKDIVIAGEGSSAWSVISMDGGFRFHDDTPCVIYGGLKTTEAAEVARWKALAGLKDLTQRSPYGPHEAPSRYFEAAGRVLQTLREEGVTHDDLIALTVRIAHAAANERSGSDDPFDEEEIPF